MKPTHSNLNHIYIALIALALMFAGCEQTVTSDSISPDELNSELNALQGPTLLPPGPNVYHDVDTFNTLIYWSHIPDAVEYKIEREKCCTDQKSFIINQTDFKDSEIIHSHLEAVDTAIPDEWLRYRVKAIFSDGVTNWSNWVYFHLPDENYM